MMFSRLGQSISQLYRLRNVLGGGIWRRSQTLISSLVYQSRYIRQADDSLGVLKQFLVSLTANIERITGHGGLSLKVYISDLDSVLANSRIHRFYSSEAPKEKNYDDFYSKEKKETLKGNNQKFESKEESSKYDIKDCMMVVFFGVLLCLMLTFSFLFVAPREGTEIYFHQLNRLLKQGLVDHIVIIISKSVAEVYVRHSTSTDGSITGFRSQAKHYINIRSIESFEKQLKEAQEALGIDYHDHVPVWYTFK